MLRKYRVRQLLNNLPCLIWCADASGSWIYVNKVWLDFTGRTHEEEVDSGWTVGVHPEDEPARAAALAATFASRSPFRLEFRMRRHDGAWRAMLATGVPRLDRTGVFAGFIGCMTDITDFKVAQAERQRDMDEKAAVMQELHHRVKNNAQVFASLLSVQASRAVDPAVKAALRVAASRAATMALAQQQIWDAGSSARFDLGALVRRLVLAQQDRGVAIEVHAPGTLFVPLATAVPLGLIVHELLMNALAHAFVGRTAGQVVVRLVRDTGTELRVSVEDDGIGMPEDRGASQSAGLTIVRSLARQLGATLKTKVAGGTAVSLWMPCPPPS
ncbi:MAG: histidine kinase dimerization/phosphoacceptor domain -containing protein [Acetobacteraceae bacterium]|nr:histidine kinase dimerization/phosphoacceptor domain -containing protein [Acetobacteraceae bacterium]